MRKDLGSVNRTTMERFYGDSSRYVGLKRLPYCVFGTTRLRLRSADVWIVRRRTRDRWDSSETLVRVRLDGVQLFIHHVSGQWVKQSRIRVGVGWLWVDPTRSPRGTFSRVDGSTTGIYVLGLYR